MDEVRHWMATEVVTVQGSTGVGQAFALMQAHTIRHLPVVEGERLIGIVSDRDLRRAVSRQTLACGAGEHLHDLDAVQVRTVMTKRVVGVSPDVSVGRAAELMVRNKIGCLPVLDGQTLVGIITDSDILRAVVTEEKGCAC